MSTNGPADTDWPFIYGEFSITNDWYNGRPVYEKKQFLVPSLSPLELGKVMYVANNGRWSVAGVNFLYLCAAKAVVRLGIFQKYQD